MLIIKSTLGSNFEASFTNNFSRKFNAFPEKPKLRTSQLNLFLFNNSSKIFGYGFALRLEERIANLDPQKSSHWMGPIMGKDGVYLVKVKSFKISPATPLLEIYEEVKNDWLLEQIDN